MSKPWQPYALNILDAIAKIQRIRMRGDIAADEALYDVVLRDLQTLSEATQLLPDDRKAAFPNIPWQEISGFRNILVHNYLGDIDPLTIAAVIDKNLPALEESIRAMLAQNHRNGNDQAH
ncbi:MAG: HepT-like ribonuclease domain-containing protein [Candidatus Nitrotoga sp.]